MTNTDNRLPIGTYVKIPHQKGQYKVVGYNPDGSYSLYGGAIGHGSYRDVRRVKPIVEKKRRGRSA